MKKLLKRMISRIEILRYRIKRYRKNVYMGLSSKIIKKYYKNKKKWVLVK